MPASFETISYTPDNLIVGEDVVNSRSITLISGQNLLRGALLGRITTGGKYNLSLSAASDGSQVPDAILAEDCNASAGDKTAIAYFTGGFNSSKVTLGASHTVASVREGLRAKGIHLIDVQQTY